MTIVMLPYFSAAIMDVMSGVLRGMGASLTPMIITVLGVCGLRVGWIFTGYQMFNHCSTELRAVMLYLVYPVTWLVSGLMELLAYRIILKKKIKKFSQNE